MSTPEDLTEKIEAARKRREARARKVVRDYDELKWDLDVLIGQHAQAERDLLNFGLSDADRLELKKQASESAAEYERLRPRLDELSAELTRLRAAGLDAAIDAENARIRNLEAALPVNPESEHGQALVTDAVDDPFLQPLVTGRRKAPKGAKMGLVGVVLPNDPEPAPAPAKVAPQLSIVESDRGADTVAKPSKTKGTPRRDVGLVQAGAVIAGTPAEGEDMAFTHAVLCQVGLPRSKVDGDIFMRRSGAAWVSIQAGALDEGDGPVMQPIPYGAMPRLALAWVSTYAKRHNTREVPVGESAADFLSAIGRGTSGGERGDYAMLRRQMHALAACRLQLGYKGRTYNGQPVEQFDAWVSDKAAKSGAGQKALWPGTLVLSDSYHREIIANGVPLDNRALLALKGSALALDVYTWLAHRLHRISGKQLLHWKSIREQFAQEYQGKDAAKDFKKKFIPALRAALAVYPQAKVEEVHGGLLLLPSSPPIEYKK